VIDIHCHILPNIDDGPSDINESIEMARIAANDGITRIVATPHIKNTLHPVSTIKKNVEILNTQLFKLGIPVEILQGADVSAQLDPSLFEGYTINNTAYILVEFPQTHLPNDMKKIIFRMMIKGYYPIITHPERNLSVIKNPDRVFDLINAGVLIQITADSITGAFGIDVEECAFYLLKRGVVNFIATDAHSSLSRKPVLSEALKITEKIIGKERSDKLVTMNPEAVLKGTPLHD
jgi:protein-tyrosine phosphatase